MDLADKDPLQQPLEPSRFSRALEMAVDYTDVAHARDRVEEWLVEHAPEMDAGRRADVLIAASELLSNAFQHADRPGAVLRIYRLRADKIAVAVTNAARRGAVPPPSEWSLPADPLALDGRGLGIVDHVADAAAVMRSRGQVTVTAVFATG